MGDGRWEMGDGTSTTLSARRWELGDGSWELGVGRWHFDYAQCKKMGDGRWELGAKSPPGRGDRTEGSISTFIVRVGHSPLSPLPAPISISNLH